MGDRVCHPTGDNSSRFGESADVTLFVTISLSCNQLAAENLKPRKVEGHRVVARSPSKIIYGNCFLGLVKLLVDT